MATIQLIQISAEELETQILKGVQLQLDDLKKHFTPKEPNEYLTRSEVAQLFSVDLSTLHNWNKKKILNPIGLGSRVYYLRSEIEAQLKPLNV